SSYQPTANQTQETCLYGKCSYIGDPHIIPFASSYGGPQTEYWCQNPGWELLISNSFVSIYTLAGPNPNYIIDVIPFDFPWCIPLCDYW
ncbi:unnamed protein product, partial [Rotaria magnacalcarata]